MEQWATNLIELCTIREKKVCLISVKSLFRSPISWWWADSVQNCVLVVVITTSGENTKTPCSNLFRINSPVIFLTTQFYRTFIYFFFQFGNASSSSNKTTTKLINLLWRVKKIGWTTQKLPCEMNFLTDCLIPILRQHKNLLYISLRFNAITTPLSSLQ